MFKLISFFIVLPSLFCYPSNLTEYYRNDLNKTITPYIVGGVDATNGQYPSMVSIARSEAIGGQWNAFHFCGGSIINNRVVLTAAQCCDQIEQIGIPNTVVGYGGTDLSQLQYFSLIIGIIKHNAYNPLTKENDLCLVRLADDIQFGNNVAKIELTQNEPFLGWGDITGWGRTKRTDSDSAPYQLKRAFLLIMPRLWCAVRYFGSFKDDMICGGALDVSTCFGDTGGPFIVGGKLAGVISWSSNNCDGFTLLHPNGFANVAHGYNWIMANINLWN